MREINVTVNNDPQFQSAPDLGRVQEDASLTDIVEQLEPADIVDDEDAPDETLSAADVFEVFEEDTIDLNAGQVYRMTNADPLVLQGFATENDGETKDVRFPVEGEPFLIEYTVDAIATEEELNGVVTSLFTDFEPFGDVSDFSALTYSVQMEASALTRANFFLHMINSLNAQRYLAVLGINVFRNEDGEDDQLVAKAVVVAFEDANGQTLLAVGDVTNIGFTFEPDELGKLHVTALTNPEAVLLGAADTPELDHGFFAELVTLLTPKVAEPYTVEPLTKAFRMRTYTEPLLTPDVMEDGETVDLYARQRHYYNFLCEVFSLLGFGLAQSRAYQRILETQPLVTLTDVPEILSDETDTTLGLVRPYATIWSLADELANGALDEDTMFAYMDELPDFDDHLEDFLLSNAPTGMIVFYEHREPSFEAVEEEDDEDFDDGILAEVVPYSTGKVRPLYEAHYNYDAMKRHGESLFEGLRHSRYHGIRAYVEPYLNYLTHNYSVMGGEPPFYTDELERPRFDDAAFDVLCEHLKTIK